MSNYIYRCSLAIWEAMQKEAKNRGFALIKDKTYGDGRIIVGTIGAFASALSSERGWDLNKNDKDHIRQYLKATGNVVIFEKLEQYRFRIFVREEWSESAIYSSDSQKDAIDRRAERLSPSEAGEIMSGDNTSTRSRLYRQRGYVLVGVEVDRDVDATDVGVHLWPLSIDIELPRKPVRQRRRSQR